MEDKKLQWSKFSPDRSEQYVIRSDDEAEFDLLVEKYKAKVPQKNAFPNDEGQVAVSPDKVQESIPSCPLHNRTMKESKYGGFYCTFRMPHNTYCKEKAK